MLVDGERHVFQNKGPEESLFGGVDNQAEAASALKGLSTEATYALQQLAGGKSTECFSNSYTV